MIESIIIATLILIGLELSDLGPKLNELGKKHYRWFKRRIKCKKF